MIDRIHPRRAFVVFSLFALAANSQTPGEKPDSADWVQRAAIAQELSAVSERLVKDDAALISLLTKEDSVVRDAFLRGGGAAQQYGEGYAEYVATLADTVADIAEKHPDYPGVWPALLNSPYAPDSQFAGVLARHADIVVPLLMTEASGPDPSPEGDYNGQAIDVLGTIEALDRTQPKPKLTPGQNAGIDAIVRSSLASKRAGVRIGAVHALTVIGTEADVPAMRNIASDPQLGSIGVQALNKLQERLSAANQARE